MISVDGVTWGIPCDIKRTAEIRASEISGLMMDKTYYNDVIATYMRYEVTLVANPSSMADYYALYAILAQDTGEHTFVLPDNGGTVTVYGRVDAVSDVYVRRPNGSVYWKGTTFSITSNRPREATA